LEHFVGNDSGVVESPKALLDTRPKAGTGGSGSFTWTGTEIPSLYGIRGAAALAVVLFHVGITAANGIFAVICFFVLSGFLITHLLLKEYDKTGDLSLRRFYLRRSLRIFPAFYGYAVFYIVGRTIMGLHIDWISLLACLTYTGNYFEAFGHEPLATMLHTWSLAVEEQFYLLWPVIFWLFAKNRTRLMQGLMAAIVAIWVYRWLGFKLNFNAEYVGLSFETRADALAIGCLLAVANSMHRIPRWLIDWKWVGALAAAIIVAMSASKINAPSYTWSIAAVGFAIILMHAVAHSQSPWYRWLESRPLRALGLISYSLYLYHPFANHLPSALRILPVEVAFVIALATGSYWIVERPFLVLKDRISKGTRPVPVTSA
jgi:peptidoglycan/LPS O-acetylase OafA/YrhL